MKNKHYLLGALAALILPAVCLSCDDDKESWSAVDGNDPVLALESTELGSRLGRTVNIKGKVTDADGLRYIKLQCLPLYLDKTIDIVDIYGEALTEYDLDYKISSDLTEAGDIFDITVTAVDVLGKETSAKVRIDMNGDVDDPVFAIAPAEEITVVLKEAAELELSFTVTDDRGLGSVEVAVPEIQFSDIVTEFADPCEYTYARTISFPASNADYTMNVAVADKAGHKVERVCVIHVSDTPDFAKMWLADVASAQELNSDVMGVPMLISHTGQFTYEARYYNEAAGTQIYFLPQRTDFKPLCYGLDPADNTRITGDAATAKPFVLDQAKMYYHITFNILTRSYSIDTYSPAEAVVPYPHTFGAMEMDQWEDGSELTEFWFGYTTEGPGNIKRFTQDADNPCLFRLDETISLNAGNHSGFIIHNYHSDGWWNYCTWRADNEFDPEHAGYYGKAKNPAWKEPMADDIWFKPPVPADGKYTLTFDAHLGHIKIVPAK